MDYFKKRYKDRYDVNFKSITRATPGEFPSNCVFAKQRDIRWYQALVDGSYANGLYLNVLINGSEVQSPFKISAKNYYALAINKILSIAQTNKVSVKTGNSAMDTRVKNLAESVNIQEIMLNTLMMTSTEGCAFLKTYKKGISVVSAENAYVVMDENTGEPLSFVLYELLTDPAETTLTHVRLEIHSKGSVFEQVRWYVGSYNRGTVTTPVEYQYKDRLIPAEGIVYKTDIELPLVSLCTINKAADKVYGESTLAPLIPVVKALEVESTQAQYIQDNNANPLMMIGQSAMMVLTGEDGEPEYRLKTIDGKYMLATEGEHVPQYIEYGGKAIENSAKIQDRLMDDFFRLSEMSEALLSSKFTGQVSEETFSNLLNGIIEKVNRYWVEIKVDFKDAFYKLCLLNDIEVDYNQLTISLDVSRTDDEKTLAEIAVALKKERVMSLNTILQHVYGYTEEASTNEIEKIKKEEQS